jgi:K+-transporting ATPase KdpF subunit
MSAGAAVLLALSILVIGYLGVALIKAERF